MNYRIKKGGWGLENGIGKSLAETEEREKEGGGGQRKRKREGGERLERERERGQGLTYLNFMKDISMGELLYSNGGNS